MKYKENVLDRIEQSFTLLGSNFLPLILPLGIFYIGVYYVFFLSGVALLSFIDTQTLISAKNYNVAIAIVLLGLIYLILEIAIILGVFKTIKDIDQGKEVSLVENYFYGFKHIFSAFVTYYYIFMYVYFLPAIIFILGGLYFLYLQFNGGVHFVKEDMYSYIGFGFLGFFLFFIYIIYRSNKIVFALVSATTNDQYTKENFHEAVTLTKGRWWRIFGNFFLVGIMIGLVTSIFSSLLGGSTGALMDDLVKNKNSMNFDMILQAFQTSVFSWGSIISGTFSRFIFILSLLMVFIFTYIFYKRLQEEQSQKHSEEII